MPRTFARFLVVGGTCYLLNLALLWLAVEKGGIHYIPATLLTVAIMTVLGHFLNRRHT
ncbi:MAG: GtrA family protein, partial [Gammaproteobacteria bacterium]